MGRIVSLGLLVWILFAGTAAGADKRIALVIGNGDYKHAAALDNPANDAAALAAALKVVGFKVMSGINLGKAAMTQTIRAFADDLVDADVAVFYYAGHGLQVNGRNYLVPIDAKLEDAAGLDFELIGTDLVQRTMERNAKTNIIFLDACRDNPLARNLTRSQSGRSLSIGKGLASIESGTGTLISFSTQPGNVATDGSGRNSPFADALAREITAPGRDIFEVLLNVRRNVIQATGGAQVPWEHSALTARFYFSEPVSGAGQASGAVDDEEHRKALRRVQEEARRAVEDARRAVEEALAKSKVAKAAEEEEPQPREKGELARELMRELKRVGCDPGSIDGTWGPKAKAALKKFTAHSKLALFTDEPTQDALEAVQGQKFLVCPAECAPNEVFDASGQCVRQGPTPNRAGVTKDGGGGAKSEGQLGGHKCRDGDMAACRRACLHGKDKACRRLKRGF